eukprot:SAG31_NODE_30473_length_380_cov_3.316726_1_plen_76_part_01
MSGVHWAPVEWEWAVAPTGNADKSVFLAPPRRPAGGGGAGLAGCAGISTVIRNNRFGARATGRCIRTKVCVRSKRQ